MPYPLRLPNDEGGSADPDIIAVWIRAYDGLATDTEELADLVGPDSTEFDRLRRMAAAWRRRRDFWHRRLSEVEGR